MSRERGGMGKALLIIGIKISSKYENESRVSLRTVWNTALAQDCLAFIVPQPGGGGKREGRRGEPGGKTCVMRQSDRIAGKMWKDEKADENAHEKKKKKLEDDCTNEKTQWENQHKTR